MWKNSLQLQQFLQYNLFFAFVVQKCRDKMSPKQHSVKQNFVKFRFSPLDEVSWFSLISLKPRSSFSRKYKILLSRCGSKKLFKIQRCYENVTTVLVIVICKFMGFCSICTRKKTNWEIINKCSINMPRWIGLVLLLCLLRIEIYCNWIFFVCHPLIVV